MDINNNFLCNICKKSYSSLSSLNYHQKNTKFCLSLQDKLNSGELIRCEYCLKEFTSKKYLSQHNIICKEKKILEQQDFKTEYEKIKNQLEIIKKENTELKLNFSIKIRSKDELIRNMKKEIEELKNTTNNKSIKNKLKKNKSYPIELNQLFEHIETIDESLQKIKESFKRENIDITDNGHPLKMLPDKILSNCRHINKQ